MTVSEGGLLAVRHGVNTYFTTEDGSLAWSRGGQVVDEWGNHIDCLDATVSLASISSAAAAQAPTIAEADCNIPALSPITSAVAPVAPALRGDANIPTLTPVSNSAASVAATIARADCNIPALTPISSTAATISLSSLIISVGLTLSTITNTVAPITPTARADATVPTLTPVSAAASTISPTTTISVAVLLAAINATAAAIDASIAQADAILSPLSPPGAVASVTSPALTISVTLTLFQYEQISLNTTLDRVILVASDIINEIAALTPIEYILPETQISESVTLVDEEGNETDTSVLEKIWRPASIPEPATIIILETSDVEEI